MTTVTGQLQLAPDVTLTQVADLSEHSQSLVRAGQDEIVINLTNDRGPSIVVSGELGELVALFTDARTIADALVEWGQDRSDDELRGALPDVYETVRQLALDGVLVCVDDQSDSGEDVDHPLRLHQVELPELPGLDIVSSRRVRTMNESSVWWVKLADDRNAAVKLSHHDAGIGVTVLEQERQIIAGTNCNALPGFIHAGTAVDGRTFLAIDWIQGSTLSEITGDDRVPIENRLALAVSLVGAYADLHDHGILHRDVHPGNIMVTPSWGVRLVDFGAASSSVLDLDPVINMTVAYYQPPEQARSYLQNGGISPIYDDRAEQWCIAAVVYHFLTGQHHVDFLTEQLPMLRQLAGAEAMSLRALDIEVSAKTDAVLMRALQTVPERRFPSFADFAEAFVDSVAEPVGRSTSTTALHRSISDSALPGGAWFEGEFPGVPVASTHNGQAGLAYALYREALTTDNTPLLEVARVWLERAERDRQHPYAFVDGGQLDDALVGPVSLLHSETGVPFVGALIGSALGDRVLVERSIDRYVALASRPEPRAELSLGRAGVLYGAAALRDEVGDDVRLAQFGEQAVASLRASLQAAHGGIAQPGLLGMAHGRAGELFALLRWHRAENEDPDDLTLEALDELASHATYLDGRLLWRWYVDHSGDVPQDRFMHGWCNGGTGMALLWTAALQATGESRWYDLAADSLRTATEAGFESGHLCCGAAGAAYAALALAAETDEQDWLDSARSLADRAFEVADRGDARVERLFRGGVGIMMLETDLRDPGAAVFPLVGH